MTDVKVAVGVGWGHDDGESFINGFIGVTFSGVAGLDG